MTSGDDGGVRYHIAKLQSLVEEEGKLSTALILATVLKMHTDVVAVRGSVDTISGQIDSMQSMLGEVGTLLGPSKVDQLKTMLCIENEPWNARLRACAERHISGTGEWLSQHELFKAWASCQAEGPQVLALEGGPNFGKTHLATTMIMHLRLQAQQSQTPRALSYYLFNNSVKRLSPGDVVRSIVYQLYTQNLQFFETAMPIIKRISGSVGNLNDETSKHLWSSLIVNVISKIPDFTSFVVFDGADLMDEREVEILCEALACSGTTNRTLRILFTGDADCMHTIAEHIRLSMSKIALDHTYPNRKDVALVADAYLSGCDMFAGGAVSPEIVEYKADICERLVQTASGNYHLLRSRIEDIRHVLSQGEMERVLARMDKQGQGTVEHQLSNLALRLSKQELLQLKDILHLLAILQTIGEPMPHISAIEQYLIKGDGSPALLKANILFAYSSLLIIDDQGYLSLTTSEITTYLTKVSKKSDVANALPSSGQKKQLETIHHFLSSTFNSQALESHGFDDEFFQSRSRASGLGQFAVDLDVIIANVFVRFLDCLLPSLNAQRTSSNEKKEQVRNFLALARGAMPKLLLRLSGSTTLDDDLRTDIGTTVVRCICQQDLMLLEQDLLDAFWPVKDLAQVRATWGEDDRYFDAVFKLLKHPRVSAYLETLPGKFPWVPDLEAITKASHLKDVASRLIAKRWLQSKAFWRYEEIQLMFEWFTTLPALQLRNENYREEPYDWNRTRDWFTPPNWEKIQT